MSAKKIFVSHTKKDKIFCDKFDTIFARKGIDAFRSELEYIPPPPWSTIKNEMSNSVALFFLVGPYFVAYQSSNLLQWKYTQNWIAYEIGLACQRGIDVWVICDRNIQTNFPMPYVNNYFPNFNIETMRYEMGDILDIYNGNSDFSLPSYSGSINMNITCPHFNCRGKYNLHMDFTTPEKPAFFKRIKCPQCLKYLVIGKRPGSKDLIIKGEK